MTTSQQTTTSRSRWARAVAAVAAFALMAGLALVNVSPAEAASKGAGWDIGQGGGWIGSFQLPNGQYVYCLDRGAQIPLGNTGGGQVTGAGLDKYASPGSYTEAELRQMNYVLSTYGQTSNQAQAAAVELTIWSIGDPGYWSPKGGTQWGGDSYYITRAPASARAGILSMAQRFRSEAGTASAPAPNVAGSTSYVLNMENSRNGRLTVDLTPNNATGTISLTGATVAATGAATATVRDGSVIDVLGTPVDSQPKYAITVSGQYTATVAAGWANNVTVFNTPGQQRLAGAGGLGETSVSWSSVAFQSDPISTAFEPVVETQVASKYVTAGEPFVDNLRATVRDENNLMTNPWRQYFDGSYLDVVATGTLYGPFTYQPPVSALAPVGAPVVGSVELTLSGPGNYASPATLTPKESGFYTWVWEISSAVQSPPTRANIPDGYYFADDFGLVAETHVSPFKLDASTEVVDEEVIIGSEVGDTLTVSLGNAGSWLTSGGSRIPVTYTGIAYFVPGTTEPTMAAEVPAGTEVLGTVSIVTTGPGRYISPTVAAPAARAGYVVWVWQIKDSDQPVANRGAVYEWSDLWAVPAEVTQVTAPTIAAGAKPLTAPGYPAWDTTTVVGDAPDGMYLTFEAHTDPDCSEKVFDSSATPVAAPVAGDYQSPHYAPTAEGNLYWVATLHASNGEVIEATLCGIEGQTTEVVAPRVTASAPETVVVTDSVQITGDVTGFIPPETTLVFEGHSQTGYDEPACEVQNRLDTSDVAAKIVTVGGAHVSAPIPLNIAGTYLWTATLLASDGTVLHRSECGAASTVVTTPTVVIQATPEIVITETATAVATVTGATPAAGAYLVFEAYDQAGYETETCDAANLVYTSEDVAEAVLGPDVYESAVALDPAGTYVWVANLYAENSLLMDRSLCDGDAARTLVTTPTVTAVATPKVIITEPAAATATIEGDTPAGSYVEFTAYKQAPADPLDPMRIGTCDVDEPIKVGDATAAEGAGMHDSGAYRFDAPGFYIWVATLYTADGILLHRSPCEFEGLATTEVVVPTVTAEATPTVVLGDEAVDAAAVFGEVPVAAYLTFEAFDQAGVDGPTCAVKNRVFETTSNPTTVDGTGEFVSPAAVFPAVGTYIWVETLHGADGTVIHTGACESPTAVTTVTAPIGPDLAPTGFEGAALTLTILALLGLGSAGLGLNRCRVRRTNVQPES